MFFRSRIGGGGVVQDGVGQGVELVDCVGELAERVVDLLPAGQTGIVVVDDGVDVVEGADVVEPPDLAVHADVQIVDHFDAVDVLPYPGQHAGGAGSAQTAQIVDTGKGVLHLAANFGVALGLEAGGIQPAHARKAQDQESRQKHQQDHQNGLVTVGAHHVLIAAAALITHHGMFLLLLKKPFGKGDTVSSIAQVD